MRNFIPHLPLLGFRFYNFYFCENNFAKFYMTVLCIEIIEAFLFYLLLEGPSVTIFKRIYFLV